MQYIVHAEHFLIEENIYQSKNKAQSVRASNLLKHDINELTIQGLGRFPLM